MQVRDEMKIERGESKGERERTRRGNRDGAVSKHMMHREGKERKDKVEE